MKKLIKFSGITNILCAILLFLSWFSIVIFMWDEITKQNFSALVQNPAWIPVNIFYLIATILLLPSVLGLYLVQSEKSGNWGFLSFAISSLAVIWYSCIQFYETFFWPLIAAESTTLFQAVGFSPSNKLIFLQLILSGIPWLVGFVLLGIVSFRSNLFSRWVILLYTIGAVLFGVGMAFPIRTLGIILFCTGMIKIGTFLLKENKYK